MKYIGPVNVVNVLGPADLLLIRVYIGIANILINQCATCGHLAGVLVPKKELLQLR